MANATIKNIETITIKGAHNVTADVSGSNITGLETISVLKSAAATVTASTTTDVNVSGATGVIKVEGGKNVVVNDTNAGQNITVGNSAPGGDAVGTITITDTNNSGANNISVEGGTDVTVTTTADKASSGKITIGDNTNGMATGNVVVTQNTTSNGTAATAGDVTVTGGKTVEITANMTNTAVKGGSNNSITAGTYTVNGGNTTTDVTITQNATAIDFENDAAAMVKETSVVTFNNMKANETLIINGLTFTASKDLTAEQVASAFANLTAADKQSATGITANGYYTNAFNATNWTSGAANGATVTFTAQDEDETDLTFTGTAATNDSAARIPTQVKTAGTAAGGSTAVLVTEKFGNVVVNDNATKSITTITLDGFDDAALGAAAGTGSLDKLATLNLTNGQGTGAGTVLTSNVATLTVNVDDMVGKVDLSTNATNLKTLTLNANGEDSDITLIAANVETLTIAAAADLDLDNGSTLSALKTVTITGAGDVTLGDISTALETLTASAATGDISAEVKGDKATVTTGSGDDSITVNTNAISKAIDLGAGNDTLVLNNGTNVVPTAAVKGGDGVDTISMTFASAASYDDAELFKNAISGFERLEINNVVTSAQTIELDKLGFTSYVTTSGTTTGATYTGAVTAATSGEKFTFFYNGLEYTATLAGTDLAAFNTAITNAVITGTTTALGTGKVTATDSSGTLVLAAAVAGNTVTAGSYNDTDNSATIVGTTAKLTLNNLAANATVVLTATGYIEAALKTATGTADVINVIIDANNTTTNAGLFTVNNVEAVKITAQGEFLDDGSFGQTANDGIDDAADIATLTLKADAAKTVTIDGYADLTLDTVSTIITKVDASAMTGDLVYTADGATAGTEVIGGAGNDILRASGEKDVLKGGEGSDTFYAGDLTTVYGGAGADKFYFATPTQLSKVSTIADLGSGDTIYLVDNENGAGVVVDKFYSAGAQYNPNTADFADKLSASLKQTGEGEATWFQHKGNTYIVIDNDDASNIAAGAVDTYNAGKDVVIEITGLVDLSTASFNATEGTLEIA